MKNLTGYRGASSTLTEKGTGLFQWQRQKIISSLIILPHPGFIYETVQFSEAVAKNQGSLSAEEEKVSI